MRVLKWIILPLLSVHIVLATISGYRAIVQVYSVQMTSSAHIVRPGTVVTYEVASSGRVPVDVEFELIQDARHDTLAVHWIRDHTVPSYDPRTIRGRWSATLTADQIARFQPGPVTVRVTANGKSQWLRVPPPRISELILEVP